ncbi:hypothetical protein [Azospirillum sp. TSO22-1]|uniref:hypothetical protein n=1 Tax=Azospirillum sp. TSO22-1 TaxID=716789 RepID=UPI000D604A1C|nr:hypothetical protein [Azospirillum sp. TSO22-1]PWC52766.1 hypothetical protein TSO221_12750 [Azospirillum sp. TSO22-1]
MRALTIALATAAAVSLSTAAFADEFLALCDAAQNPQNAKVCKCAAGKLAGADRAAAFEAAKAMKAAMASGKPEDANAVTTKHAKGLEILRTAQATCL